MEFKDKYTDDPKETSKKLISSDAFAVGEMIEILIKKIEHLRISL